MLSNEVAHIFREVLSFSYDMVKHGVWGNGHVILHGVPWLKSILGSDLPDSSLPSFDMCYLLDISLTVRSLITCFWGPMFQLTLSHETWASAH